jgi:cytochrome c oxidase cbb3-type subunit III
MIFKIQKNVKFTLALILVLLFSSPVAWAGGPPAPSLFSNTLAVMLIVIMILLLIVIAILGNVLVGAADLKLKNRKKEKMPGLYSIILMLLLLPAPAVFAQDATEITTKAAATIGGMSSSAFYLMIVIIFLELVVVIVMLINIKLLIRKEKEKIVVEDIIAVEDSKQRLSWWDKLNKLRPVSQEAELDLGHEYDGIRELNNKLPPWWLYGFYLTIIFAVVYLWRFHVSHTGPSSQQEYEMSVVRADKKIKEYLKAKGDAVDENTVKMLTAVEDLEEGKAIYMKSCASCHTESGAGNVGPNLTDDFWLHGNDIKNVFKTIRYGINAMPQWQNSYSNKQMAQVSSYVKSLHGTNPANAKAPQGIEMKEVVAALDSTGGKNMGDKTVKQ